MALTFADCGVDREEVTGGRAAFFSRRPLFSLFVANGGLIERE
jgi:hypothetical protein